MKNYRKISPKRLRKLFKNYENVINFYKKEKEWWEKDSQRWFNYTMTYTEYYKQQIKKNKLLLYWNLIISVILIIETIVNVIF